MNVPAKDHLVDPPDDLVDPPDDPYWIIQMDQPDDPYWSCVGH